MEPRLRSPAVGLDSPLRNFFCCSPRQAEGDLLISYEAGAMFRSCEADATKAQLRSNVQGYNVHSDRACACAGATQEQEAGQAEEDFLPLPISEQYKLPGKKKRRMTVQAVEAAKPRGPIREQTPVDGVVRKQTTVPTCCKISAVSFVK